MKKQRGFTLIELLAIIVILAILLVIAIPNIVKIIDKARNNAFTRNEQLITNAARTYFYQNTSLLPLNNNDSTFVSLNELISSKLIDNIIDPKDRSTCNIYSSGVAITKSSENTYTYLPQLNCNNYSSANTLINNISSTYNSGSNNATINITLNNKAYVTKELLTPTSTIVLFKPTLIDYSNWVLNTYDTQGNFNRNGVLGENQIMLKTNPWGINDIVWSTQSNDIASNDDGGWNIYNIPIDKTKKYRLSVWVRREDVGNGTIFFGTTQSGGIANLSDGTVNSNPYFYGYTLANSTNNWVLLVGYIHPYNYSLTTSDSTNGIYDGIGKNRLASLTDYKFTSTATICTHRTYLYYSTAINEKVYWYRPRFEVVDGTEPSISDLLNGNENININDYASINKTGIISYTVSTNGIYDFYIKKNDNSLYKFSYTVSSIQ